MKIIKQFKDPEFYDKRYGPYAAPGWWAWGLGDDGELYCQSTGFPDCGKEWHELRYSAFYPRLKDMKKIVKEFGNWLVWI
jgi:hypothetical protein